MNLFIDAFNIKEGGGLTHLKELLAHSQPLAYGFTQVIVFASSATLQQIPEMPWLVKEYVPALDKSVQSVWFWRTLQLPEIVKKSSGFLFIPGSMCSSVPFVTMCQNLLPVQKVEMNRYKGTKVWWRLILLRWLHKYSFQKAAGVIFLNAYCQVAVNTEMNVMPKFSAIIPHGINQRFMKKKASYAFNNVFKLVYVSIIDEYKHQWKVAEAVYQLNKEGYEVELYLVGTECAKSRERLDSIQKANPNMNQVKLLGKVDYTSLDVIYMEMDAAIYASTCETLSVQYLISI
jgi:glycosyltransferase involved in cell wall biosynthesis